MSSSSNSSLVRRGSWGSTPSCCCKPRTSWWRHNDNESSLESLLSSVSKPTTGCCSWSLSSGSWRMCEQGVCGGASSTSNQPLLCPSWVQTHGCTLVWGSSSSSLPCFSEPGKKSESSSGNGPSTARSHASRQNLREFCHKLIQVSDKSMWQLEATVLNYCHSPHGTVGMCDLFVCSEPNEPQNQPTAAEWMSEKPRNMPVLAQASYLGIFFPSCKHA